MFFRASVTAPFLHVRYCRRELSCLKIAQLLTITQLFKLQLPRSRLHMIQTLDPALPIFSTSNWPDICCFFAQLIFPSCFQPTTAAATTVSPKVLMGSCTINCWSSTSCRPPSLLKWGFSHCSRYHLLPTLSHR
jgi:hypothetical protein